MNFTEKLNKKNQEIKQRSSFVPSGTGVLKSVGLTEKGDQILFEFDEEKKSGDGFIAKKLWINIPTQASINDYITKFLPGASSESQEKQSEKMYIDFFNTMSSIATTFNFTADFDKMDYPSYTDTVGPVTNLVINTMNNFVGTKVEYLQLPKLKWNNSEKTYMFAQPNNGKAYPNIPSDVKHCKYFMKPSGSNFQFELPSYINTAIQEQTDYNKSLADLVSSNNTTTSTDAPVKANW